MKANELRELSEDELNQRLEERRSDLWQITMQSATGVVDDVRAQRVVRRDIARIITIQREKTVKKGSEQS